ncbi:MAG TPA: 50S ribosomal protein L22 [Clostridia bacterium]|nr:50S ribosomal protein L22 [Clostridia bacterium]
MEARALVRYVRITPRKVQSVADLVRGKKVDEALAILKHTPRAAASVIEKLVKSAAANAENNHGMDTDSLYIYEIYVNQGSTMKRYRPRAFGRAAAIRKRTSHIGVVLREK